MIHLTQGQYDELQAAAAERDRLHALINTPELINFPAAVHLEAVHQEQRWGSADRESKTPYQWFWLLGHLATRALEHHKEAERLAAEAAGQIDSMAKMTLQTQVDHHREKAVHHAITSAAVLNHWHASMLGKQTGMYPGPPKDLVKEADGMVLPGNLTSDRQRDLSVALTRALTTWDDAPAWLVQWHDKLTGVPAPAIRPEPVEA